MMKTQFFIPTLVLLLGISGVYCSGKSCNFTKQCEFVIKSDDVCTKLVANAVIDLEYMNSGKEMKKTVCLPCNTSHLIDFSGTCDQSTASKDELKNTLTISWNDTHNNSLYEMNFVFKRYEQKGHKYWTMETVNLYIETDNQFPDQWNASTAITFIDQMDYNTSYECMHSNTVSLQQGDTDYLVAKLMFSNLRVQAFEFRNATTGAFDKASKCSADRKALKIVPIAVGASLGFLIIVSLVLYILIRFRSHKKSAGGYKPLTT